MGLTIKTANISIRCWRLIGIALLLFGFAGSLKAQPDSDVIHQIDIPSMNAADALNSLAIQTGTMLLFPYEITKSVQANPVSGQYSLQQALDLILLNTGLSGGYDGENVLRITQTGSIEAENKEGKTVRSILLGITGAAVLATTPHVFPQELEEIVVTSRRYAESLQEIPQSVTALNQQYLEDQGIERVTDIISFTPGGNFTRFNKMQDEYSLRGVSSQTEGAAGDPSVVTVIDNVVITKDFMKNPAFFDMERVEILRGPQGTSFGRNATSGLIHLISARPEDEYRASITADVGSHEYYGVEAFVTGPLNDNLLGRLAVNLDTHDGYSEDTRSGQGLGGEQNTSIRGSLIWTPSNNLEIYVKAELNKDDDDTPAIRKGRDCTIPFQESGTPSVAGPPVTIFTEFPLFIDSCDPWKTTISESDTSLGPFFLDREIFNLTTEIVWDLNDRLTATTVLGYIDGDSDYMIDSLGSPNDVAFQSVQNDAEQLSAEFRLDNHASGSGFRWLAGLYMMNDEHDRMDQGIFFLDNSAVFPPPTGGFIPETRDIKEGINKTDSLGIFGEISYDLTENMNLTLGGRWSRDEKDYSIAHYGWGQGGPIAALRDLDENGDVIPGTDCNFFPPAGLWTCGDPDNPVGFTTPTETSNDWDNASFKASLTYDLNDDMLMYALASQGYKTGGFQPEPPDPDAALVPYDEETATNYELGFKGEWGGIFRLNASIFNTDYEDLQLLFFQSLPSGNFTQVIANAANVDIQGIELDWVWQASRNLRFSGSYANHDAELVNALLDLDGDMVLEDLSGTRPDNTPEYTATMAVEYVLGLQTGAALTLRGDWRAASEVYDDVGEQPGRAHEAYDVFGVRATWLSASDKWSAALWARNIFEEDYTVNMGPAQPNSNQLNFAYGQPRTFGATLTFNFD